MKNELTEDLISIFIGWFISGGICLITLMLYWYGFEPGWRFELTLLIIVNLGFFGFLVVLALIIIFLCKFKIVRK